MDRRVFLRSSILTGFSALLAVPTLPAGLSDQIQNSPTSIPANSEIHALEALLRENPGVFLWHVHNELRHQYLAYSEAEAMKHADIILAHTVMDSYILNTLSDWQTEKVPGMAVMGLLSKVQRNPSLLHLRAASLIKAGDVCRNNRLPEQARQLYQAAILRYNVEQVPTLKPYLILVDSRLQQ